MESTPNGKFRNLLITASSLTGLTYLIMFNKSLLTRARDWFRWSPTSPEMLESSESKMLSYLKRPYDLSFVPITMNGSEEEFKIRSFVANKNASKSTPLVLLHGFASGIGLWVLNIDSLSVDRPVYAIDLLGFGLSSRPTFKKDAALAEDQFIESIEQWRKKIGLNHFILLGHSMGGFLAAAYSIRYPERIKHLILADPWGFPTQDLSVKRVEIPMWAKVIAAMIRPFNPLVGLRVAGPWGPNLVKKLRPDILRKFEVTVEDTSDISNYIYHCNAQCPSGEAAFKSLNANLGWAKHPLILRVSQLRQDIPITFIYGSRSWVDSNSGYETKAIREKSFVDIKIIQAAGHHVYADKADEFNSLVNRICEQSEENLSSQSTSIDILIEPCISKENLDSKVLANAR